MCQGTSSLQHSSLVCPLPVCPPTVLTSGACSSSLTLSALSCLGAAGCWGSGVRAIFAGVSAELWSIGLIRNHKGLCTEAQIMESPLCHRWGMLGQRYQVTSVRDQEQISKSCSRPAPQDLPLIEERLGGSKVTGYVSGQETRVHRGVARPQLPSGWWYLWDQVTEIGHILGLGWCSNRGGAMPGLATTWPWDWRLTCNMGRSGE